MLSGMRLVVFAVLLAGCGSPTKPPITTGSGSSTVTVPPPPTPNRTHVPKSSGDVQVVITGKVITMNGFKISGTPMLTDLEAAFGPADRVWESGGRTRSGNRIHTWDRLGLLVYEPYDGRCVSATFPYKPMTNSFTPKTSFSGSIKLDGNQFNPSVDLATVKGWAGATQPYSGASIVFDREDFHVFTIQEQTGNTLDLVEVSFWQKGTGTDKPRKPPPPPPRVVGNELDADCRGGDSTRCTNLALAFQTGANGRKNPERAFELAKLACTGGDAFGCLMLGNMHDAGRGTAKSKPEAQIAWKRACTLGYKAPCDLK